MKNKNIGSMAGCLATVFSLTLFFAILKILVFIKISWFLVFTPVWILIIVLLGIVIVYLGLITYWKIKTQHIKRNCVCCYYSKDEGCIQQDGTPHAQNSNCRDNYSLFKEKE
jgi:hypothetical protein